MAELKKISEYEWEFPEEDRECRKFVLRKLKEKIRIKKPYQIKIISKEQDNLIKIPSLISKFFNVSSKVHKRVNWTGTIYYELNINKREEVQKLIDLNLIPNIFKLKNN